MISWRPLAAFAVALPLLAGCSGADAVRAQQLLQQAQQAQQQASSETFSAHLNVTMHGQAMQLELSGGGYMKGSQAGDMYMDMHLSAPVAMPFSTVRVAKVGTSQWLELDGKRMALPSQSAQTGSTSTSTSPLAAFDFTRYVKDVKVQGGQTLNGSVPRPEPEQAGPSDVLLQRFDHLGQARVPGDQGQTAGGGPLRGDHPERLRDDGGDHQHVRSGQRQGGVAMIQAPGESDPLGRHGARGRGAGLPDRRRRAGTPHCGASLG